jgi:dUTP pyrophosphatase
MNPTIEFKRVSENARHVPRYVSYGSAGLDLHACLEEDAIILPGNTVLIKTGLAIRINDPAIVGLLVGRSGMALKSSVRLANCLGVVDSDYQLEIGVALINDGNLHYTVKHGDRIAQIVFLPVFKVNVMLVNEFSAPSDRGGWGSSGS